MSEKITAMIEEIKGLTVLELSELVHALEEVFGVSAAAMAAPAAAEASRMASIRVALTRTPRALAALSPSESAVKRRERQRAAVSTARRMAKGRDKDGSVTPASPPIEKAL